MMGKTEIEHKENYRIKLTKKPKNKVTKICNEPGTKLVISAQVLKNRNLDIDFLQGYKNS